MQLLFTILIGTIALGYVFWRFMPRSLRAGLVHSALRQDGDEAAATTNKIKIALSASACSGGCASCGVARNGLDKQKRSQHSLVQSQCGNTTN